jgi:hypothetical protein
MFLSNGKFFSKKSSIATEEILVNLKKMLNGKLFSKKSSIATDSFFQKNIHSNESSIDSLFPVRVQR